MVGAEGLMLGARLLRGRRLGAGVETEDGGWHASVMPWVLT